ncbi:hypothetical protein ACF3MZ_12555 [Paenibacillaceae bacterium WGS1546]|uniref:hypothetical protein n=1 Tax=Cohnella sp. WGS1546 TaxID=3366810 RepID=UPI00372D2568
MTRAAKKVHYINEHENENENANLMAAYRLRIAENEKLLDEIQRINRKLHDMNAELMKAQAEAGKYREMYDAIRRGHYLLIPK